MGLTLPGAGHRKEREFERSLIKLITEAPMKGGHDCDGSALSSGSCALQVRRPGCCERPFIGQSGRIYTAKRLADR